MSKIFYSSSGFTHRTDPHTFVDQIQYRLYCSTKSVKSSGQTQIGRTWFLDQEIPKGGFIKIQESSLVWDEWVKGTRIITTEGLSTCMEPGRRWTITSGSHFFLKKQERWKGCEQELITTIQKEGEQMEEKEDAGYRSPTWEILRALQQVNKATRIEGETIMSTLHFFKSAGREDLKFWGTAEECIIWESLSELEKKNWLCGKLSTSKK